LVNFLHEWLEVTQKGGIWEAPWARHLLHFVTFLFFKVSLPATWTCLSRCVFSCFWWATTRILITRSSRLNRIFASETIRESSEPETLKVENDLPPKNVETLYSNFPPVWEKLRSWPFVWKRRGEQVQFPANKRETPVQTNKTSHQLLTKNTVLFWVIE
jgi:hypothetical protein